MLTTLSVRKLCFIFGLSITSSLSAHTTAVDVFYPKPSTAFKTLKLTGTVEAAQNADLASLQAGVIEQLFVEVGDKVSKGQKLLALDATLAKLTLAETKASVDSSKVSLAEAKRLYQEVLALSKQQVVAQTLINERKAAVAAANAELARQTASLARQTELVNRHTLYAPFAGIIASRNADLGEWVTQQTSVFNLVEQDKLRLALAVPQEYYQYLTHDQGQNTEQASVSALITPDFNGATSFTRTVSRLVAVSNQQSRTLLVHIDLSGEQQEQTSALVPGMSATAELQFSLNQQNQTPVIWLPEQALKQHPDGGSSVFAVVNNQAKRFIVNVLEKREQQIAVTGAPAEHAYVTSGIALLRDGQALTIKSSNTATLGNKE
ncbi:efflux RND transporter periplasmic adaptor subunit [Endozoicomonas sp. G2_1]|uniref:efflux RND transporter periplasmic adaptor subunit n=1 Tax=Endozoicomonas sp. G2_1 TaxID=2821091 RepID=UPI001AD99871|nr:efflux RND transporter periplasmic adaptor subunit [Endozoicomonas sp. G2_1]MBO9491158.1 efflux RND transporter periplasmic adaptor subunit [Endozoicomonas sp. G2_1]